MKNPLIPLLLALLLAATAWGQGKVKELTVEPDPDCTQQFFRSENNRPGDGYVVIYTTIPDLTFSLANAPADFLHNTPHFDPQNSRYILCLRPTDDPARPGALTTYRITLSAPGHKPATLEASHLAVGQSLCFRAYTSTPAAPAEDTPMGYLVITSSPSGADVYLDGQRVGATPFTRFTRHGTYAYRLELPLYEPLEGQARLDRDRVDCHHSLTSTAAQLSVLSLEGATIILDGVGVGTSAFSGPVAPGPHQIEARLANHRTARHSFTAQKGQPVRLTLNPEPILGRLRVETTPIDCRLAIDGHDRGLTPAFITDLPVGEHTITITNPGYRTETRLVTIADDQPSTLKVELVKTLNATEAKQYQNTLYINYNPSYQTATITRCRGDYTGDLIIADTFYHGDSGKPHPVTHIDPEAFANCDGLTSVRLPDGVNAIAPKTFRYCSNLKTIVLPAQLEYIHAYAFYRCTSLKNITLPETMKGIGHYAFSCCYSLQSIRIPGSVDLIDNRAFEHCTSLADLTIEEGVRKIYFSAFSYCTSLKEVRLPQSTTELEAHAFHGCASLATIHLPGALAEMGPSVFSQCASLDSVVLPPTLASIPEETFKDCTSLTTITIPEGVKAIGRQAFAGCTSLTAVTIPASVTLIDEEAFLGCESLTSVTILNPKCTRARSAFRKCHKKLRVSTPKP